MSKINDERYQYEKFGNIVFIIMKKNNYVNAAKICSMFGKKFYNWNAVQENKDVIKFCSQKLNILESDMTITIRGGNNPEITGTYVHPVLVTTIMRWISPEFESEMTIWIEEWKGYSSKNNDKYFDALSLCNPSSSSDKENRIRLELKEQLNAKDEVKTKSGYIDLLTDDSLIEIKHIDNWKAAIGQLMVYGMYYPNHQKVLCLFDVGTKRITDVRKFCKANNICLKIHD